MNLFKTQLLSWRVYWLPLLIALFALGLVLREIDAVGNYPQGDEGPGVTIDEIFNVEEGYRLATGLPNVLTGVLTFEELFGGPQELGPSPPFGYHNPDHPPLGRLWIGVIEKVASYFAPPGNSRKPFTISTARVGSAVAFAATVFLICYISCRWYGDIAAVVSGCSLILMPRLFGHAHLASLETVMGLGYAAVVLLVAHSWKPGERINGRLAILTGLIFGLVLLIKIQAILLPIPLLVWYFWNGAQYRKRKQTKEISTWVFVNQLSRPIFFVSLMGLFTFYVCWPWLWLDPIDHFQEYFARTTSRATLNVWYFGTRYADNQTPWHYPWIMFFVTVPVGLHCLGIFGLWRKQSAWKTPQEQLILICIMFPLCLFSFPKIAIYDGVRLFLVVFPLWGIFIGKGGSELVRLLAIKLQSGGAIIAMSLFLVLQSSAFLFSSPCYLSSYNLLLGGTEGASAWGMERDYWGTALTRSFLNQVVNRVPENSTIYVAPVLHQFQLPVLLEESSVLRRHGIILIPYQREDLQSHRRNHYVMLFMRLADLPEELQQLDQPKKLIAENRRSGVLLAALYLIETRAD